MAPEALSYPQAIEALEQALWFGINPSLEGIVALCEQLGRPQDSCRFVQVTGTNGKTSVARLTAALLSAHGLKTACYTSPHLVSYTERIEIEGAPAAEADMARALSAALDAAAAVGREFTEFELLTAAGLWLMRDLGVEWGVLEVGMGGRWDATSVVSPAVAVVTGVSLDHTDRLGTTVEAIAADKAHIIKQGSVAVFGPGTRDVDAVLGARATEVGAPIVRVRPEGDDAGDSEVATFRVQAAPDSPGGELVLDVETPRDAYRGLQLIAPSYQAANVAVAVTAAEAALGTALDEGAALRALAAIRFPGRFELIRTDPPVVLDGGHNPEAAAVLAAAIDEAFGDTKPVAVIGMVADKDAEGFIRVLAPHVERIICTRNTSYRARAAVELAAIVASVTGVMPDSFEDLREALDASMAAGVSGVVVTGSLYTVGEARALLM